MVGWMLALNSIFLNRLEGQTYTSPLSGLTLAKESAQPVRNTIAILGDKVLTEDMRDILSWDILRLVVPAIYAL